MCDIVTWNMTKQLIIISGWYCVRSHHLVSRWRISRGIMECCLVTRSSDYWSSTVTSSWDWVGTGGQERTSSCCQSCGHRHQNTSLFNARRRSVDTSTHHRQFILTEICTVCLIALQRVCAIELWSLALEYQVLVQFWERPRRNIQGCLSGWLAVCLSACLIGWL